MAGKSLSVRTPRPKTKAQIEKAQSNALAHMLRTRELASLQKNESAIKKDRFERRQVALQRTAKLLEQALSVPQFATWADQNDRPLTAGTAALFFARFPHFRSASKPVTEQPQVEQPQATV